MSTEDIRLRLTVRRHGLPESKLLWPCTASENLTISKLLSDVNEVVPLESEQWGLEDYAVELNDGTGGSFECLHFQQVRKVLKNDDQVLIRSLLTDDLKRRRLSGRHQISYDGKHLVDGVAFGRPLLRAARGRPPVDIPPRKRARIEYTDEDADDDDDAEYEPELGPSPKRIAFRLPSEEAPDSDNEDYASDSTTLKHSLPSDHSADGLSQNEEETDLEEELRALQEDDNPRDTTTLRGLPMLSNVHEEYRDGRKEAALFALKTAFPSHSKADVQHCLEFYGPGDLLSVYEHLAGIDAGVLSYDEFLEHMQEYLHLIEPAGEHAHPDINLSSSSAPKRPLIQEVEDTIRSVVDESAGNARTDPTNDNTTSEDDDDTSDDSSFDDSDSDEEDDDDDIDTDQVRPTITANVASQSSGEDSDTSDSESSSASSDDEMDATRASAANGRTKARIQVVESSDSSSDESSDDDSSDDATSSGDDSTSSEDDSSSSSGASSDSEPEELTAKRVPKPSTQAASKVKVKASSNTATSKPVAPDSQSSTPAQAAVPPRTGLTKTQKRNQRRREMQKMKALGQHSSQSNTPTNPSTGDADFLARKQALLNALNTGDETQQGGDSAMVLDAPVGEEASNHAAEIQDTTHAEQAGSGPMDVQSTAPEDKQKAATTDEESPRPRTRMDLGAGRRMLFGALGLKAPKTKADEEKLRQDLMKDVRPLKNHRQAEVAPETAEKPQGQQQESADNANEATDDTDWRAKISYRAVECNQPDIQLSEPPFPFVQRWDPQQRVRGKRKRKSQNQHQYYDESYQEESNYYEGNEGWDDDYSAQTASQAKKNKNKKGKNAEQLGDADNIELNYDDPPATGPTGSSQLTDVDDLPSLPSDLVTLPALQSTEVKPGMVITWKQLLMSKATNWQPEVLSVTGLVVSFANDGMLHVVLAKRDREQDEKEYDEDTGRRVYDKFEMPSDSEDEAGGDDGRRELAWAELIEPRLVQGEPAPSPSNSPAKAAEAKVDSLSIQAVDSGLRESPVESLSIPSRQSGPAGLSSAPTDISMNDEGSGLEKVPETQSVESQPLLSSSSVDSSSQVRIFPPSSALEETSAVTPDEAAMDVIEPEKDSVVSDGSGSASASAYQDATPSLDTTAIADKQHIGEEQTKDVREADSSPTEAEVANKQSKVDTANEDPDNDDEVIPDTNESSHEALAKSGSTPSPRLDEGDGDESDALPAMKNNDSIRNLFPNATQPSLLADAADEAVAAEPDTKRKRRGPSGNFEVPEGSQVIALSSSSPGSPESPSFSDSCAEDNTDANYKDENSSVPHGATKKNKGNTSSKKTAKTRKGALGKAKTPVVSASAVFAKRKKGGRKF